MPGRNTTTSVLGRNVEQVQAQRQPRVVGARYRHILVPTNLAASDVPALMLGMELAALHGATLAVLHVLPDGNPEYSVDWLAAIDRLHRALDQTNGSLRSQGSHDAAQQARSRIKHFIEQEVPAPLRDVVEVHAECRSGDTADKIAQFAEQAAADVVIMSSGLSRWWLPILPATVRRVLQLARRPVILVRPDTRSHRPAGDESM